ncbi:hypothetical protein TL16_g00047 [Triparma laevis f. inornata]|uniref:Uncharacterized protein n=1 Tax=Triparma laevis f. inornata TaxID=1714386 RepID=A0A9W6Z388_9STRA|nr:hypothetical protein TL16_g00047 [Triparma laevis f. inornata]
MEIHEDPDKVLESIIEDRVAARDKLNQKLLKEATSDNETIVHWTFVDQNKNISISLLLLLKVERDGAGKIRIAVESIEEEDLDTVCLQVPKPTTAKAFRLLLNGGSITLKSLPLGRTSFTFTAQADLREEEQFNAVDHAPSSRGAGLIENLKTGFGFKSASSRVSAGSRTAKRGDSIKVGELLCNVVGQFYVRFEKEAVRKKIDEEGRRTFIIAWAPMDTYAGTHHEVAGAENMVEPTTTGVHIIKEFAENTCEWTRVLQADLKFTSAMPVSVLELIAKIEMRKSNEEQEKFRRNGKEVDRERVAALAGEMRERRGKLSMADQKAVFKSCEELFGDGGEEGWKALESTSKDVEMSMKYFPSEKGERSVGTGKAVGVVDCSAEEVAAWVMDVCSNERMRISTEERNPARLELREKTRVNE